MKSYKKDKTKEISFPLGGIGAGCIGLSGNGSLRDWEIYNHPNKNTSNGFSHIMVRAESEEKVLDARVLQGGWLSGAIGGETNDIYRGNGGFGHGMGPYRGTMAGVPHFRDWEFKGEYPFAEVEFQDPSFPGKISLKAFSPFIPLNDRDSSLPGAFFEVVFTNPTEEVLEYTAFFTLNNPLPDGTGRNHFQKEDGISRIVLECDRVEHESLRWGNLCIATNCEEVSFQEYWYRAQWFDSLESFWRDVNAGGKLKNRSYPGSAGNESKPYKLDGEEHGTLAAHCRLNPGETKGIRFVLAWFFPNCGNTWNPEKGKDQPEIWKNYYTKLVSSAEECALYCLNHWERLYKDTRCFKDALYRTTLPEYCIEAVSANMSILKTATCLRLENGEFYGFEGSGLTEGICEGSCSHVWNYAYALPYLFPKLERSMRDLDFRYNQREDGAMSFRLMLPLGRERYDFRPCVDGQMGGVIKAWRDYLLCGDKDWLQKNWIAIKKSIEFAWSETNEDCWDGDKDGVMEGRQHHTMDMELFGPSSWLNGFYLAALSAGAKIADVLGYEEEKSCYLQLYEKGRAWCDQNLFNGEYFVQMVDLKNKDVLKKYDGILSIDGFTAEDAYWNEEVQEIKYQIAHGCATDQVLAQWHANLCGLGDIFEKDKVKSALKAIYRYNRVECARNTFNAGRVYALDDDSYLRICAWPSDKKKPAIPLTYSDEVFCGLEYQAAAHMVQEGMLEEGFSVVKSIRDRFDGEMRNPWNEFECGNNYARSMASFSLIPAISGYTCDVSRGFIGFDPKTRDGSCEAFFSLETGWGVYSCDKNEITLSLLYGSVSLREFGLPKESSYPVEVSVDKRKINFRMKDDIICFDDEIIIKNNEALKICFA